MEGKGRGLQSLWFCPEVLQLHQNWASSLKAQAKRKQNWTSSAKNSSYQAQALYQQNLAWSTKAWKQARAWAAEDTSGCDHVKKWAPFAFLWRRERWFHLITAWCTPKAHKELLNKPSLNSCFDGHNLLGNVMVSISYTLYRETWNNLLEMKSSYFL